MTKPNKLEGLPLVTLSSRVLELEGKTQLEDLSDASFLGKLLVLPANVRLGWKVLARCKHSSLFDLVVSNKEKKFYNIDSWLLNSQTATTKSAGSLFPTTFFLGHTKIRMASKRFLTLLSSSTSTSKRGPLLKKTVRHSA